MRFIGNVDVGESIVSNVVIGLEDVFPASPKAGRFHFGDKRLYFCVEIASGLPVWIPLTNELNTASQTFQTPSNTWTFVHGLLTTVPVIQVYDDNHVMFIPDSITVIDNTTVEIGLSSLTTGTAVAMHGSPDGSAPRTYAFKQTIAADAPVMDLTVQHNLGYNPAVSVVMDGVVVLPASITHPNLFSTFITFTSPTSGEIRLL